MHHWNCSLTVSDSSALDRCDSAVLPALVSNLLCLVLFSVVAGTRFLILLWILHVVGFDSVYVACLMPDHPRSGLLSVVVVVAAVVPVVGFVSEVAEAAFCRAGAWFCLRSRCCRFLIFGCRRSFLFDHKRKV